MAVSLEQSGQYVFNFRCDGFVYRTDVDFQCTTRAGHYKNTYKMRLNSCKVCNPKVTWEEPRDFSDEMTIILNCIVVDCI